MRQRRGPAITTILAVLLTVAGVLIPPAAAPAGAAGIAGIGLPLEFARDVVVDPGTGRIFVSGDDAVVVRTPTGATLKTITGIPGALDLTAAGGAIYAVGATSHRIARIDPVGLTITRTYPLPVTPLLRGVALHGGKLWTVATTGSSSRALVSIDPATGTGVIWSEIELGDGPVVALLSTPSHLLVAVQEGIAAFTYAADDLTLVAETDPEDDALLASAVIGPDGASVVAGYRSPDGIRELALPGLTLTTQHPVGSNVAAVAVTAAGGGLIAGTGGRVIETGYQPDTHLFRPGAAPLVAKVQLDQGDDRDPILGALAWSADGTTLWALRDDGPYDSPLVPALVPVPLVPTGVSVSPRTVAPSGASTTFTGRGFTGATVEVDGSAATTTYFRPTTLRVDLPDLDLGPAAVTIEGLTGATSNGSLVVRDLGPFTSSFHLVQEVEDGFFPSPSVNELWAASEDSRLAGGGSIGALAAEIARSADWVRYRDLAARLYLATFDRPADPEGLRYWWSELSQRSLISAAAFFARSSEFVDTYGALSDAEFVELIYQNVLDRDPDAAGADYWEGRLAGGLSRGAVLAHFSESAEHRTLSRPEVDVTFLSVALLHRSPTPEELAAAAGRLRGGGTLAAEAEAILRTPEYATLIF